MMSFLAGDAELPREVAEKIAENGRTIAHQSVLEIVVDVSESLSLMVDDATE